MADITFPITQINEDKFKVAASLDIYSKEAINAACYKFSGDFFVHQEFDPEKNYIIVTFESKDNNLVTSKYLSKIN